jgi:membrane-associated phospholipid phosphatase
MEYIFPGDIWLIHAMQDLGDWLSPVMKFFTWLGYPQAYMIIFAIIYWSFDRKLGLRLALFLPVAASLNSILKQAFHAPRPYWVDPDIKAIDVTNGFGMPSGHAQGSTVWLYAGSLLRKRWIWSVAIPLAFFVGLSRVYLGVHFPSQVLTGWLTGIAVLIIFYRFERKVLSWFLNRSFMTQLFWISGATLLILMLGGVFVQVLKNWEMPLEWISNAADDLSGRKESILSSVGMGAVAGNAGGFMGVALGALLSHRKGGFDAGGMAWKRIVRSVTGLLGFVALYALVMRAAPDENRELLYSIWRFCGFFLMSVFAIYVLPLLFRRINLLPSD